MMIVPSLLSLLLLADGASAFSSSLPPSSSTALSLSQRSSASSLLRASSVLDDITTQNSSPGNGDDDGDDDDNDWWHRLQVLSDGFQEQSGRILFHEKELIRHDEDLAVALKQEHHVDFTVPSNWHDAMAQFTRQPQTQVLLGATLVSMIVRLVVWPWVGVSDVAAVVLTPLAYQLQEYGYHRRNYHGNDRG
ncbi:expressed unknown protein (Partial), partial [Seminavis robusta]